MLKQLGLLLVLLCGFKSANATLSVVIDGKKQSTNSEIILNAGYHEIIFVLPENTAHKYEYRLENLENSWKISTVSVIRYTNLDGGKYVFHCKTIFKNKVIANDSVSLEIKEDFWEKWWFLGFVSFIVIVFVSLVIYFWFLYDFRQRMKVEAIRERIAADLHDEVGANLNSITFITEMLRKQNTKNEKTDLLLEKISTNSIESATLISDTIWALNPNYDSFEKLIERIKSFALGLLSAKDIAFSIENNLSNQSLELSIGQRRNLYLIIKEALNNIAKHSKAKKAFLRINETENGLKIIIEDDGVGFDATEVSEGNGLKNYQIRAIDSDITVKVNSTKGSGVNIEIELNLKNH
jgi:two-component sensor histidine kinase